MDTLEIPRYNSNESKIFFTSDLHLGHRNIMKFCKRPFATTEEMDETIINNWNSIVGKDDIIFDLGDFAFATNSKWKEYITRLNGHHHLILGNHDITRPPSKSTLKLFESICYQKIIMIDNIKILLNHYPFLCYAGTYRENNQPWQLFGHVHSGPNSSGLDNPRLANLFPYQYDVGVDNNNFKPVEFYDLLKIFKIIS